MLPGYFWFYFVLRVQSISNKDGPIRTYLLGSFSLAGDLSSLLSLSSRGLRINSCLRTETPNRPQLPTAGPERLRFGTSALVGSHGLSLWLNVGKGAFWWGGLSIFDIFWFLEERQCRVWICEVFWLQWWRELTFWQFFVRRVVFWEPFGQLTFWRFVWFGPWFYYRGV